MNMWLVGAGYWGSKLIDNLKKFDVDAQVIDIRNGQAIRCGNTTTRPLNCCAVDTMCMLKNLWQKLLHRYKKLAIVLYQDNC